MLYDHSLLSVQTNSSYHCWSHGGSVCLLRLLLLHVPFSDKVSCLDRQTGPLTLFVVVTTNSVSSRAILPVMVLASTPKTGMVILRGLFHESFVSVTHRLVCYQETLLLSILTIILLYDPSLTCKFTPTLQAHTRWFKWACFHDW